MNEGPSADRGGASSDREAADPPIAFEAALPGDVVVLEPDDRADVATVFRCHETVGGETVAWIWLALDDGRLLELAPRGCALYGPATTLSRGSARYQDLVAQDGALVRFEERVRAGTWAARPVRLTLEGRRWRVTSTGTVTARRLGDPPPSCWGQLGIPPGPPSPGAGSLPLGGVPAPSGLLLAGGSPDEPTVYFTLAGTDDSEAWGLGLWATDVCLAFGQRLGATPEDAGIRLTR